MISENLAIDGHLQGDRNLRLVERRLGTLIEQVNRHTSYPDTQTFHVSRRIRLSEYEILRSSSTSSQGACPRSRIPRPPSWTAWSWWSVHDAHDSRDVVAQVVRLQRVDDRDAIAHRRLKVESDSGHRS